MKFKPWALALFIILLALGLVACQTPDETTTPEDTTAQQPEDGGYPPETGPADGSSATAGAVDDAFSGNNSSPITGDVLANDTTTDGQAIDKSAVTVSKVNDVANGALLLNADGTFSYQALADFVGDDTFRYKVCANDDAANCGEAQAVLTVTAGGDGGDGGTSSAPVAQNDVYTVEKNGELFANVLENDSDPNGESLTVTLPPAQGVLSGTLDLQPSGQFLYTPTTDFEGVDGFVYQVCNVSAQCGQASAVITVGEVSAPSGSVTANDDSYTTPATTPITFNVLENDVDASGGTLTVTDFFFPGLGNWGVFERVEGTAGDFTYSQLGDMNADETLSFSYTACNANGECDEATATVTATKVDDGQGGGVAPGVGLVHTVENLEWLLQVARCYGTTEQEMLKANTNIIYNRNWLYPGQVLNITNPGSAGAVTGPPCVQYHTVAQGETLNSIATAYGIKTSELQRINAIYNANYIQVGQRLVLPTPIPPEMAR